MSEEARQTSTEHSSQDDPSTLINRRRVVIDLTEDLKSCANCAEDIKDAECDYALHITERERNGYAHGGPLGKKRVHKIFGLRDPCLLCGEALRLPTRPAACGQVFCDGCLREARQYSSNCPACRTACCDDRQCKRWTCLRQIRVQDLGKASLVCIPERASRRDWIMAWSMGGFSARCWGYYTGDEN
ncbi:uncharacterized protein F4822DRAFT_431829 [Hypoxylon trugodes]|uniref:uncharacterized protein n=1 Tax=Hypoxylon trugodes TaxID=326681 RepID=UPI00218E7013|nr:uncharacterized protein F4822DRAFT_431829 [Hypoxylon trugodes]KAI1386963.1 hypothetical protein F4822DRAFT_431829 [Hypoxylon trugodes]